MTRAPSNLPFSLEPYPNQQQIKYTQQHKQISNYSRQKQQMSHLHERYISSMCRVGPLPQTRHQCTDIVCLISYIFFAILCITLFLVNLFSEKIDRNVIFSELGSFGKFSFSLNQTLTEIILSCTCIVGIGIILLLFLVALPKIFAYFVLFFCCGSLLFIGYSLIGLGWGDIWYKIVKKKNEVQMESNIFKYSMIAIIGASFVIFLVLVFRRFAKLKYLAPMMAVVKTVVTSNLPAFPLVMLILLNLLSLGIWAAFTKILWNTTLMANSQKMPVPPPLISIFIFILWLWTHGILISISDYICQSWVVNWYFNSNHDQNEEIKAGVKYDWKRGIFKRMISYHFGTCISGFAVSAYIPQNLLKLIRNQRKKYKKDWKILQYIETMNRYSYIETVLQCYSFWDANRETRLLLQRIKQKIPQIYMLGHFLQETLKIILCITAMYIWFFLSYNLGFFVEDDLVNFSPLLFISFSIFVILGVFLETSTNITHLFGMVSDVAIIAYSIDCQIQRVHYNQNKAHSVPKQLKQALLKLEIQIKLLSEAGSTITQKKEQTVLYD